MKLYDYFGYDILFDIIGEDWVIFVYLNGFLVIKNGEYKGKILVELW